MVYGSMVPNLVVRVEGQENQFVIEKLKTADTTFLINI